MYPGFRYIYVLPNWPGQRVSNDLKRTRVSRRLMDLAPPLPPLSLFLSLPVEGRRGMRE
jgi:hypothetical protein